MRSPWFRFLDTCQDIREAGLQPETEYYIFGHNRLKPFRKSTISIILGQGFLHEHGCLKGESEYPVKRSDLFR